MGIHRMTTCFCMLDRPRPEAGGRGGEAAHIDACGGEGSIGVLASGSGKVDLARAADERPRGGDAAGRAARSRAEGSVEQDGLTEWGIKVYASPDAEGRNASWVGGTLCQPLLRSHMAVEAARSLPLSSLPV